MSLLRRVTLERPPPPGPWRMLCEKVGQGEYRRFAAQDQVLFPGIQTTEVELACDPHGRYYGIMRTDGGLYLIRDVRTPFIGTDAGSRLVRLSVKELTKETDENTRRLLQEDR